MSNPLPVSEQERLAALARYEILDTPAEQSFDDLVTLAGQICEAPIALISLVDRDRQWFKAKIGIDAQETPRSISACQYAIEHPGLLIVPDTLEDARFKTNPLVTGAPHMRFYAGAPLTTPTGHRVGTICLLDTKARNLTEAQKFALKVLADHVVALMEMRVALKETAQREQHLHVARQQAVEAARQFRLVLDSTAEAFYSVDAEGVTTLCNRAFLRILGYDSEGDVLGRKLHGEIHHSHPDGTHYDVNDCPIYQAASAGKSSFVPHEFFFRRDGTPISVEYRAEPILHNGRPNGAVCTFIDITERLTQTAKLQSAQQAEIRVQNRLAATNEQFRMAQEAGGVGAYAIDRNDPEMTVSDEFRRIYGLPAEGAVWAAEVEALVLAEDREKLSNNASRADGSAALDTEYRIHRMNDGQLRWIARRAKFVHGAEGLPTRMLGVAIDITDRKQAMLAVEESQAHLSLMVESAQDFVIFSMDSEGSVVSWNLGAERTFGFTAEEVIGKPLTVIFTPEDVAAGAPAHELSMAAAQGRANDERWHMRKNGERFYASGIMASMKDESGAVKGFIKIARDMTAQQHAQEAIIEARNAAEAANIAKTEFLANMSHEIRTPMNAIIGLSNILSISEPLTQKQKDFVRTLQLSADSLLGLINDLLDITKIEARTVELEHIPFNLTQMVQEVVSMMAVRVKEKNLSFVGKGETLRDRMFLGDPTRLRQIVLNLCSNAIKFTEKGQVSVSITAEPGDVPEQDMVCIAVRDTGIGIAADKLETIFQKFVQADTSINRKYGGTGLGLAITKTLTEIMGGTITVESTPGQGSCFRARIPLTRASDHDVRNFDGSLPAIMETAIQTSIKPRILLVEDYPANILVASTFLEQFGYAVEVATDGMQAVEMTKDGQYVAALMDVQMHGMNGLEATQLIRGRETATGKPRLHIIGMTAHALFSDRERCLGAGMDDYISKPFNPDELKSKLQAVILRETA